METLSCRNHQYNEFRNQQRRTFLRPDDNFSHVTKKYNFRYVILSNIDGPIYHEDIDDIYIYMRLLKITITSEKLPLKDSKSS
jgi:hypothetical protein